MSIDQSERPDSPQVLKATGTVIGKGLNLQNRIIAAAAPPPLPGLRKWLPCAPSPSAPRLGQGQRTVL